MKGVRRKWKLISGFGFPEEFSLCFEVYFVTYFESGAMCLGEV